MPRPRRKVALVFGEDDNDRSAIIELIRAIAPGTTIRFEKRAKPPVLLRRTETPATRRSALDAMLKLIRAARVADDVVAIIAHRDCDDVEPAHNVVISEIKKELTAAGVQHAVVAAPAFEMEAWWLLFPEAVNATCGCWTKLGPPTRHVGMIHNAKEHLTRALRPKSAALQKSCPEYCESDSIDIASNIRSMNLISRVTAMNCGSLFTFKKDIEALKLA